MQDSTPASAQETRKLLRTDDGGTMTEHGRGQLKTVLPLNAVAAQGPKESVQVSPSETSLASGNTAEPASAALELTTANGPTGSPPALLSPPPSVSAAPDAHSLPSSGVDIAGPAVSAAPASPSMDPSSVLGPLSSDGARPKSKPKPKQKTGHALDTILGKVATLSEAELIIYQGCEAILCCTYQQFVDVGQALELIHAQELFRAEFDSFEAYYRTRWQFEHSKVYAWMWAAKAAGALASLKDVPQPCHEAQLRPLYGLKPAQMQEAWKHAAALANGRRMTARFVKKAVCELNLVPTGKTDKARINKTEQRQRMRDTLDDLIMLISRKAAYCDLMEKAELLNSQFHLLLAKRSRARG